MKTRSALVSLALVLAQPFAAAAEPPAKPAPSLYQQGLAAVEAGDPVLAEACFTKALQQDPNNANAKVMLDEVKRNAPSIAAKGREAKFGRVMIPSLQLDGATVKESVEVIAKLVARETKDQISANFIVDDPKGSLDAKTITLKLTNIPAKAALEYVLSQVGAKARFDEHAIVIVPRA